MRATGVCHKCGGPRAANTACRPCTREYVRARYAADPSKELRRAAKYRAENPEAVKNANYKWAAANPEKVKAKKRRAYWKNPEKERAAQRAKHTRYAPIYNAGMRRWRKANPDKANALSGAYQRAKSQATPAWLSAIQMAQVEEFYDIAAARTVQTGVNHEVDHVFPLRGKNISGLHVPWNLQVLTERENISKGNRL